MCLLSGVGLAQRRGYRAGGEKCIQDVRWGLIIPGGSHDPREAVIGVCPIPTESWVTDIPRTLSHFLCNAPWGQTVKGNGEQISRVSGKARKKGEVCQRWCHQKGLRHPSSKSEVDRGQAMSHNKQ